MDVDELTNALERRLTLESILGDQLTGILDDNLRVGSNGFRVSFHIDPIGEERSRAPMLYYAPSKPRDLFIFIRFEATDFYYKIDCRTGYYGVLPLSYREVPHHLVLAQDMGGNYNLVVGTVKPDEPIGIIYSQAGVGRRIKIIK